MKRFLLLLTLAVACSVWTTSNAQCLRSKAPASVKNETLQGTLEEAGYPCEKGEDCAECMVFAIQTSDRFYYMTSQDPTVWDVIDSLFLVKISVNCICAMDIIVIGRPYHNGSFDYIDVAGISGHLRTGSPTPTDSISLYKTDTEDDPGSSTVDPVDPTQVVATLNGNELTIQEYSGDEIGFTLTSGNAPSNESPALKLIQKEQTFRYMLSVLLNEQGTYTLHLSNPNWDYTIIGTFDYSPQGIERIQQPGSGSQKILREGQLLIRQGEHVYTTLGIPVE